MGSEVGQTIAKRRSLINSMAITMAGNGLTSALWLTSGMLAARLLGPKGRGELAAIQMWGLFLASFALIGMPDALVYFTAREPQRSGSYTASAVMLALLGGIPLLGLAYLAMPFLLSAQDVATIGEARLYLLVGLTAMLGQVPLNALRGSSDFVVWNALRVAGTALGLMPLILAWLFNHRTAEFVATAHLIFWGLLFSALILVVMGRRVPGPYQMETRDWKPMLAFGLPSVVTVLPQTLNLRLDQMLMAAIFVPRLLGLYVVAVAWAAIMTPLFQSVAIVLFPHIAGHPTRKEQVSVLARVLRLGVPLALGTSGVLALVTPWGLPLVFGRGFGGSIASAIVLVFAGAILGINQMLEEGLARSGRAQIGNVVGARWSDRYLHSPRASTEADGNHGSGRRIVTGLRDGCRAAPVLDQSADRFHLLRHPSSESLRFGRSLLSGSLVAARAPRSGGRTRRLPLSLHFHPTMNNLDQDWYGLLCRRATNRPGGRLLWLALLVFVVVLNLYAPAPLTVTERVLASGIILLAVGMIWYWTYRGGGEAEIGFLPAMLIVYFLEYGFTIFTQKALVVNAYIDVRELQPEAIEKALLLSLGGLVLILCGYYWPGRRTVAKYLPKFRMSWRDKNAVQWTSLIFMVVGLLMFFVLVRTNFSESTQAYVSLTSEFFFLGMITLLVFLFEGELSLTLKVIVAGVLIPARIFLGMAQGQLGLGMLVVMAVVVTYATMRRRLPWSIFVVGFGAFVVLQPVKVGLRQEIMINNQMTTEVSQSEKAAALIAYTERGWAFIESFDLTDVVSIATLRLADILVFATLVERTPSAGALLGRVKLLSTGFRADPAHPLSGKTELYGGEHIRSSIRDHRYRQLYNLGKPTAGSRVLRQLRPDRARNRLLTAGHSLSNDFSLLHP